MTSKYIRECRYLMHLRHRELKELFMHSGFPYHGKSRRRKLRMAATIVIYRRGPNFIKNAAKIRISRAVKILIKSGQI